MISNSRSYGYRRICPRVLLALPLLVAALASAARPAGAKKCRFTGQASLRGPGINPAFQFTLDGVALSDLPGHRMGRTPRGEEASLSEPYSLEGPCFELAYHRDFRGEPAVEMRGSWYRPPDPLVAAVERAISLGKLVHRVHVGGAR